MNNLLKVLFIVFIETLEFYYLPSDTLLQIFCSAGILIHLAFGMYTFKRANCSFSWLDTLTCTPYMLLLANYLIWDNWLRSITNIILMVFSTMGLYGYLNSKSRFYASANSSDKN